MYKLAFYVPENEKETVKQALFSAGAGKYENYDCCSWEVLGTGQFRPLTGSTPFIGSEGLLEVLPEYRVEMVCSDALILKAVEALIESHPYEEPAYEVWKIDTLASL